MLSGAVAAGKSLLGCQKGFMLNLKYPGNRGLICRKEARSLPGSTITTLFEQVIPQSMIISYNSMSGKLVHKTPRPGVYSTIMFSGLDKKADQSYPTKIGSTEYGWIFPDEAIELTEGDWMMLSTRLRYKIKSLTDKQNSMIPRQIFTATNPGSPYHWLYKFFFVDKSDDREVFLTTPYENPFLPDGYLKALEGSLTGISRERLLHGRWVIAEGVVYKSFDPRRHVVKLDKLLKLTDYKELIIGADANYPLPRAAVLIGIRGDGSIDILKEFYKRSSHVEEMTEWGSQFYKQTGNFMNVYHDPSDPEAINKIKQVEGLIGKKAENKVLAGISEVGKYFDTNKIRISEECRELIKELHSYSWMLDKEGEAPNKVNDHACFVAKTKILTNKEHIPIYKIKIGDKVLTRKGWKKVLISKSTGIEEIYKITISNGKTIRCTGNHPFWIEGKGLVRADALRYSYILIDSSIYLCNQSFLIKEDTTKEKMGIGEGLEEDIICIGTSGNTTIEKSQKDIISTTKTKTKTIMKSQTLNVCHQKNTENINQKSGRETKNISIESDPLQKSGMQVKKEENGIPNMEKKHGRIEKSLLGNANNVEKNTKRHSHQEENSVTRTANKKPYVLGVRKLKRKQQVYNIYVEDCHEYFAEGVLVSNCDALRYALYSHKINSGDFTLLKHHKDGFF